MFKYLRYLLVVAALIGGATPVAAQVPSRTSITTAGSDCSTATNCSGFATRELVGFGVYINVGTSGTFNFEVSQDATSDSTGTWVSLADSASNTSATTDGAYYFSQKGFIRFRLRASAISGAATVEIARGFGLASGGGGGDFTISAFNAAFGTAGTADTQVMSIQGIASMTPVQIADNGGSITVDGAISCSNCTGSGASDVDDSSFGVATDSVAPAGGMFDDTSPDSVDEGDSGVVRMSANRNLYVRIRDNAGNERGLNIDANGALAADTEATAAAALADNTANPTVGAIATYNMCFDGTTWDRCPTGTGGAGAIDANTGRVTIATDDDVSDAATLFEANLVAHDAADAGSPLKVGLKAIAFGTNPTEVAAADRTDWYANRQGIPWVLGGSPNIQTLEAQVEDADGALTDAAIVTVSTGTKIVVTQVTANCDASTTNPTNVAVLFDTDTTPPARAHTGTSKYLLAYDGVPAGGGISRGDGSGIIGVGADDEDVRITLEDPVGGACSVTVSYFTIAS